MPVPIPGSKVGSDNQIVKFLTIFGRPKTSFFDKISGVPGQAPLATNHAVLIIASQQLYRIPGVSARAPEVVAAAAEALGGLGPAGAKCPTSGRATPRRLRHRRLLRKRL